MKIILIGFMGSGKTSVAGRLAKKLGLKSIDMDELILKSSGFKSINEIFEKKGEKSFRAMELVVARKLADADNMVISTGGGVVMSKQIMDPLSKNSMVIYLKLRFDNARKRVYQKKIRPPLFQDNNETKKLFNKREPLYTSYSDIIIDTHNMGINEVLENIIVKLRKGKNGRE